RVLAGVLDDQAESRFVVVGSRPARGWCLVGEDSETHHDTLPGLSRVAPATTGPIGADERQKRLLPPSLGHSQGTVRAQSGSSRYSDRPEVPVQLGAPGGWRRISHSSPNPLWEL